MYVPARRVNQRVNLHVLFVVPNQSLSVSVVYETSDENPAAVLKLLSVSVSFHSVVPCSLMNFALYMYTCAGKVSSFFVTIVLNTYGSDSFLHVYF